MSGVNAKARHPDPGPYVTEAEFLSLPESMDKVELIDGEVFVAPSPTFRHQFVLRRLVRALEDWAAAQSEPFEVVQSPSDVKFGLDRILQPDAYVLAGTVDLDHKGPITRIPLLCVEVLSTNRSYDRIMKRALYAEAGVAEYWTVRPSGVIERWNEDYTDYDALEDRLRSRALPGLDVDVRALFTAG